MFAAKFQRIVAGFIIPLRHKRYRHDLSRLRRDLHGGRRSFDEKAERMIPFLRSLIEESLDEDDPFLAEDCEMAALGIMSEYMDLVYDKHREELPKSIGLNTWNTIQNIPPQFCSARFRLDTPAKLSELFICLQFPPRMGPFTNGSYIPSEELFLYCFHRLSSVGTTGIYLFLCHTFMYISVYIHIFCKSLYTYTFFTYIFSPNSYSG